MDAIGVRAAKSTYTIRFYNKCWGVEKRFDIFLNKGKKRAASERKIRYNKFRR